MPSATPKNPDVSRRSAHSRTAILRASVELVGEVGYPRLTIEAIAARAGVGKQTIYRWWPSKAAVLLEAFTDLVHTEEHGGGLPDTGDLEADLKAVLRATADEFSDAGFEAPYRALAVASAADPELAEQFAVRLQGPGRKLYAERLRAAQRAGQIDPAVDPDLAVELLLGPFQQRWLNRTGPLTHEFTDGLVELVLRALTPRPAGN
ncbi:TetR/AcrR family transcriptional regulator [Streptomyces sp. NPDC006925]|uniref:TetR/AcrR family transcriptional regulator n=1 Tax=Streptomyces sp. NPDC006925 TaxID=3364768 RepID=UPI00368295EE